MTKQWRLSDIDFDKACEYISSQDPDLSLRFFLPIPDWMNGDRPAIEDENIKLVHKQSGSQWRFIFTNYKDNAQQGVKIDGSSAIVFMGLNKTTARKLKELVAEYVDDPAQLTPGIVANILERSHKELGLVDRFNKGLDALQYFHPYATQGAMGAFLPDPNRSAAVYLPGDGEFLDGPTLTPQKFTNGAFINFPGKRLSDLFKGAVDGRLVQADVFVKDRTNPDGSKIDLNRLSQ